MNEFLQCGVGISRGLRNVAISLSTLCIYHATNLLVFFGRRNSCLVAKCVDGSNCFVLAGNITAQSETAYTLKEKEIMISTELPLPPCRLCLNRIRAASSAKSDELKRTS